jgi:hypothetical protein
MITIPFNTLFIEDIFLKKGVDPLFHEKYPGAIIHLLSTYSPQQI